MAKPLDPKELVTFKELLVANSIQVGARVQLRKLQETHKLKVVK
jgi:hypothetical protein